jgi:hypothetical protein
MLAASFCSSRPRDATRRMSATELVCAAPSQQRLRRSSVAAPSQQHYNLALNSSRFSSRCCQQHLEEGRGGTSRGDARCAQHQPRRSSIGSVQGCTIHDTKYKKNTKNTVLHIIHGPPESVLSVLCVLFPAPPVYPYWRYKLAWPRKAFFLATFFSI